MRARLAARAAATRRLRFARRAVACVLLLTACDERFEFDVPRAAGAPGRAGAEGQAGGPAGAGGSAPGGGAPGAAGGAFGNVGGSGVDGSCGMRPACPVGLHCVDGACHACATDDDCDSAGLARCDPLLHRCVECIETADCIEGFRCDALAHRCLESCGEDDACPPSAHGCDRRRMVCFQCDWDQECEGSPLGNLCAVDGSGCVQCRADADCQAARCDGLTGRCVECRDGSDCSSGLCEPTENVCLPGP